jgi:hypothetical protein
LSAGASCIAYDASVRGRWLVAIAVASCGRFRFDPRADGGANAADAADAAVPRCDPAVPFGAPTPISELNIAGAYDSTITLTPDELTAYWYSDRGNMADAFDLWTATRSDPGAAFTNITPMTALDSPEIDKEPGVTPDGSLLAFVSTRSEPNGDIYVSTPVGAAPVAAATLNSTAAEYHPFFQLDSTDVYFASSRAGPFSIYHSMDLGGGAFANPTEIPDFDIAGTNTDDIAVASGGVVAYFRSDRPGGLGGEDIWRAQRESTTDAWGAAVDETEVNSTQLDTPSWISRDLCRFYLSSSRSDVSDLYVATRAP